MNDRVGGSLGALAVAGSGASLRTLRTRPPVGLFTTIGAADPPYMFENTFAARQVRRRHRITVIRACSLSRSCFLRLERLARELRLRLQIPGLRSIDEFSVGGCTDWRCAVSLTRYAVGGQSDSRDVGLAGICRSSSSSRPSASICATTPNSADRSSSRPVSTVSLPFSSGTIEGKAERAVAPSRPLIRIVYKPGALATRACCRPAW
jgi:hypothetical protein